MFQYISCCSLSFSTMCLQLRNFGFNTSHVVVYRMLMIQVVFFSRSFNTSHVVVYRFSKRLFMSGFCRFNTSHVVVYPYSRVYGIDFY